MKCAYYQQQKQNRMTAKDREQLNEMVGNFMDKLIVSGADKALEMTEKENKKQKEVI